MKVAFSRDALAGRDRSYSSETDEIVATGTRERSTWSGRPILSKIKLVPLAGLSISLLLYLWLIVFSERVSTSYVSPVLLDAKNILWLTAHRMCTPEKSLNDAEALESRR